MGAQVKQLTVSDLPRSRGGANDRLNDLNLQPAIFKYFTSTLNVLALVYMFKLKRCIRPRHLQHVS